MFGYICWRVLLAWGWLVWLVVFVGLFCVLLLCMGLCLYLWLFVSGCLVGVVVVVCCGYGVNSVVINATALLLFVRIYVLVFGLVGLLVRVWL